MHFFVWLFALYLHNSYFLVSKQLSCACECPTRFNRDYPQQYQAGIEHFIPFTEDINRIVSQLNHH
jgi:hypothetical protein